MQNGGYVAEIYRGGLQSVSQRQYEAGRALGMRRWTLYTAVIMPQVIARVIPPMTNQGDLASSRTPRRWPPSR